LAFLRPPGLYRFSELSPGSSTPSRPLLSVTPLLLLSVRHFAEHAAAIRALNHCYFSVFEMASQLHCSLASVIKKRRTTSGDHE
jgi:hypothetical protein